MKANEIRRAFLDYFAEHQHRIVSSSSLIPYNDPTLLFSNAGMNQFKDTFLGKEKRDYSRATTSQKCMRVSGKHNDFEDVGRSYRHHTFFEMLGNFSFGDYFKREAIAFAWELVTKRFGLPVNQLLITVYEQDDEAFGIWEQEIGIPKQRIFRFGEKDNFWAMGDTGPCGPCSEIHYDSGKSPLPDHPVCDLTCSCGRYVELWNLVFMQFNRDESGILTPLPSPSIDTGMGFERITTVLQGKNSNYDTDLFLPILQFICELTAMEYGENEHSSISMRIIADHARAAAFLVGDSQYPGNDKRGYVLRKILRRAIIHGRKLGLQDPFLYQVAGKVGSIMQDAYPELSSHRETIAKAIQAEEESFANTLSAGLKEFNTRVESLTAEHENVFPGGEAFFLYDTRGLPLETIRELCRERGLVVDEAGFEMELEKQRLRSRQTSGIAKTAEQEITYEGITLYLGHDSHETKDATIHAILMEGKTVSILHNGQQGILVLDKTPFYAEAGGQVGDIGFIGNNHGKARVQDTQYLGAGSIGHHVLMENGFLRSGDTVTAAIELDSRLATQRNHTATHLLHASLRRVLGEHVKQAGSLVAPDRLRFDFSHYAALTPEEIEAIEHIANNQVLADHSVRRTPMKLEDALKAGAMALFGEKYQDVVTVLEVNGFSRELCGGTHVRNTGQIGIIKIASESSIAAGIRRIEAITGTKALQRFRQSEEFLDLLCQQLKTSREELLPTLERSESSLKELQKKNLELQSKLARQLLGDILAKSRKIGGVEVVAAHVENLAQKALRELADNLRNQLQTGIVILGTSQEGKASLVVMVSPGLLNKITAVQIVKEIAPIIAGGGGGKPELAEAGGKKPEMLGQALEDSHGVVARLLSRT